MNRRRRARGFALLQLGMALAALALIAGIVYGVESYLEGIRTEADKAGYERAMGQVAKRDNKALLDAQARVNVLEAEKRALEQKAADDQAVISANYQKGLKNEKTRTDRFIADVRAGRIVLRDPGQRPAAGAADGVRSPGTEAAAGACRCDGPAGTQLSDAAAEFLLLLAGEADDAVQQLDACQAVVRKDREICR